MKKYLVMYDLSIIGATYVDAEDPEDAQLKLNEVNLPELVEQRQGYDVYMIGEPKEFYQYD